MSIHYFFVSLQSSFEYNTNNQGAMNANDYNIQVFLTCQETSMRTGRNRYTICDGIDNIEDIIPNLLLNNKDVIYVHLPKSVSKKVVDNVLMDFCKKLIKERNVLRADYTHLSMPNNGVKYYTVVDVEENLLEDRYLITYRK